MTAGYIVVRLDLVMRYFIIHIFSYPLLYSGVRRIYMHPLPPQKMPRILSDFLVQFLDSPHRFDSVILNYCLDFHGP
jgi:hypothetical protein